MIKEKTIDSIVVKDCHIVNCLTCQYCCGVRAVPDAEKVTVVVDCGKPNIKK
jgi:hypothetical protein